MLFASGEEWVGSGIRSVESGLEELFGGRPRSIVASAYSLGEGAFDLPERWIGMALGAGANVVLLVDRYARQPRSVTRNLDALARACNRLSIFSFEGPARERMHAKVVVRDESRGLIGSPNWSGNGFLYNHEMAVMVEGETALRAATLVRRLTASRHSRRCA